MEDAATAEIARAQMWQWLNFGATLAGGRKVTRAFFAKCLAEEMQRVKQEVGGEAFKAGRFGEAIALFKGLAAAKTFEPFLTIPAYRKLL
jgi:malate synthase